MSLTHALTTFLPSCCSVTIPKGDEDLHSIISRWSDLGIGLPLAVIVPSTEEDIIATIKFALKNGLRVVPGNGGHGVFVPVDNKTIYLDMKNFNAVTVDKSGGSVTIGGGTLVRDVVSACVAEGCYTLTPNSSDIGVVGVFLGGGTSFISGLHGIAVDHVLSIRIIPSSTLKPLTLTNSSTGPSGTLFAALRGAGHGLGIVTSLTLRTFPISALNMPNNQIWNRKLVFPASAIAAVAKVYVSLLPPPPHFLPVILFGRAPPGSPTPGAPMIILSANYYGPPSVAETVAAPLLSGPITDTAIVAETALIPFARMNDVTAHLGSHGGFKEMYSATLHSISASSIVSAYEKFVKFGDENPDAKARTYAAIGSWSTAASLANASRLDGKTYYEHRDRGAFFQFTPWYERVETRGRAEEAAIGVLEAVREEDERMGREKVVFANNMVFGQDFREIYTKGAIEEVKRVKKEWDPEGVFWSPIGDERFAVREGYL